MLFESGVDIMPLISKITKSIFKSVFEAYELSIIEYNLNFTGIGSIT